MENSLGCVNITLSHNKWSFCLCKSSLCNYYYAPFPHRYLRRHQFPSPPHFPCFSSSTSTTTTTRPNATVTATSPSGGDPVTERWLGVEELASIGVGGLAFALIALTCCGSIYWFLFSHVTLLNRKRNHTDHFRYKRYTKMRRLKIDTIAPASEFSGPLSYTRALQSSSN